MVFLISILMAAARAAIVVPCAQDGRYAARAQELQEIAKADQDDRVASPVDWSVVSPRDERRRMRVAEIFAEGCLQSAQDYAAAALIFQHGNVPDHYFQTFMWAKKGVTLGDDKQKLLMAEGLDRYLISSGHKQLFATQAQKEGACRCLPQYEPTFPEARRGEGDWSLAKGFAFVDILNQGTSCPTAQVCTQSLASTPAGFLPGFW